MKHVFGLVWDFLSYLISTLLFELSHSLRGIAGKFSRRQAYLFANAQKRGEALISDSRKTRLEIGSTIPKSEEWMCIDRAGGDLRWDVTKGLPFKSGSFLEVYSSHTFEHFSGPELEALLGEIYRVLSPSGSLSCAVPDAERYLKAYASGSSFRDLKNTFQNAAYDTGSTIDIVNYIAYLGGEHRILLDAQILEKMFLSAGFREVGLRSFDSIRDMLDRDNESIYFFGSKSDR